MNKEHDNEVIQRRLRASTTQVFTSMTNSFITPYLNMLTHRNGTVTRNTVATGRKRKKKMRKNAFIPRKW